MIARTCAAAASVFILCWPAVAGNTPGTAFTAEHAAQFFGKNYCEIDFGRFASRDGHDIDAHENFSVEQRWQKPHLYLFLLKDSKPPKYCGSVDGFLDLTAGRQPDEYVNFKCRERGGKYTKYPTIFGLGSNNRGHRAFIRPRLAWRVDLQRKEFVPMDPHKILCDTRAEEE